MDWCILLEYDDYFHLVENIQQHEMVSLLDDMNYVVSTSVEELDNYNKQFYEHAHESILITNEEEQHIPVTVYSLLTPMISLQSLNQIMLLFGRYATEIYMSLHVSIRENVLNATLIGMNDNE